jgi:two-component system, chemotaxis family, chemotaxis protein CheY
MRSSSSSGIHIPDADLRNRFANTRVLVADRDLRIADLVRKVLYNFGFRHVNMVDSGEEALHALNTNSYELLITEWNMYPTDGIALVKAIRRAKEAKRLRRDIPIIMLTGKAERDDVREARDAGITEFLVKPFSAKTLSDRIVKVIDYPRVFVEASVYAGPCRRRRQPNAPEGKERRRPPSARKAESEKKGKEVEEVLLDSGSDLLGLVAFLPPNAEIKKQIGEDVSANEILTEAVVNDGQQAIREAEDDYVAWARDDIMRLEEAYAELTKRPADPTAHHLLISAAYAIKTQAGTFGYDLGSEVGRLLVEYLNTNAIMDTKRLTVIRKHIDAIAVIFNQKIKETGREIAEDLVRSLHRLISKMG